MKLLSGEKEANDRVEIKETSVMVQSDDVASYVFPSPVMCCQLTKMGILVRNVVTGIVLRMVEPGVGEGGSYLDGVEVFMWREGCFPVCTD